MWRRRSRCCNNSTAQACQRRNGVGATAAVTGWKSGRTASACRSIAVHSDWLSRRAVEQLRAAAAATVVHTAASASDGHRGRKRCRRRPAARGCKAEPVIAAAASPAAAAAIRLYIPLRAAAATAAIR